MNAEPMDSPIDIEFSRFIESCATRLGKEAEDTRVCRLLALLLSQARGQGHSCIELAEIAGSTVSLPTGVEVLPDFDSLQRALSGIVSSGEAPAPFVMDRDGCLYLYRYFQAEKRILESIHNRLSLPAVEVNSPSVKKAFERLFPCADDGMTDWQGVAAFAALRHAFTIIAGGAGTGKTTTVARMIALYILLNPDNEHKIALAAPTGKAATRLKESIHTAWDSICTSLGEPLKAPEEAHTVHRLLGISFAKGTPIYDESNPLPYDLIVLDESSMVDVLMMDAILQALRPDAKVILIGDPHQLTSVETGAVLGDLCQFAYGDRLTLCNAKSSEFAKGYRSMTGRSLQENVKAAVFQDSVTTLQKAYRFDASTTAIHSLAHAILCGEAEDVLAQLHASQDSLVWHNDETSWEDEIFSIMKQHIMSSREEALGSGNSEPEMALATLSRWRFLCGVYNGKTGVEAINQIGLHHNSRHATYAPLTPVMIEGNHYGMNLMNGDMGVVVPDSQDRPAFYFPGKNGSRRFPLGSLPSHSIAYAISIHKSQGSEFDTVIVVLPKADCQILTRELLYTAVTRARKKLIIFGTPEALRTAIDSPLSRKSGLAKNLGSMISSR